MKASGHVMNIGAFSALQVMFHAPPLATSPATRSNNTGINNAPRLRPECRTEACPSRHLQRLISLRTLHRQFFLTLAGSISVWIKRFLIEEIIWHQPKKPRMRAKTKRFLADADQLPGAQAARMVPLPDTGHQRAVPGRIPGQATNWRRPGCRRNALSRRRASLCGCPHRTTPRIWAPMVEQYFTHITTHLAQTPGAKRAMSAAAGLQ